jgi:transposase
MTVESLFTQALGLAHPWFVETLEFDPDGKQLLIHIDFVRGSKFANPQDPTDTQEHSVHDTVERKWQHLNFFQYHTIITARLPRIKLPDGSVRNVQVPWGRPQSGFTLMMEAFLLGLVRCMTVAETSRLTGISEDRIWHLVRTRVNEAWKEQDWKSVKRTGVDETSTRKGHNYATAFCEIQGEETERGHGAAKITRLLYFTPGKDKETFARFVAELKARGVDPAQIEELAMDMSPAFISAAQEHFPNAVLSFDRFHVMKLCGQAIDEIRKQLVSSYGKLPKGAMWALRGNPDNLKAHQLELRENLCKEHKVLARAMALRDYLSDTWNYAHKGDAEEHLKGVLSWLSRSRLAPFVKLGKSLRKHWDGIIGYYKNFTTSAAMESLNSRLQQARARARGYRRFENFQAIAYWIAGDLKINTRYTPTH